jgi:MFS family permease
MSKAIEAEPSGFAIAALALAMLLASLGTSIANVALPTLAEANRASLPQLQWVILAYLLAITCTVAGAGRLGDTIGRKRLLSWGIGLYSASSLLCAAAPDLPLLIAARAGQGLGAAAMMALAMAMVNEASPAGRTGRTMGLLGSVSAAGTALGPAIGGVLIALAGWRSLFLLCAAGGGAALVLAWRHLPRGTAGDGAPFDLKGPVILAATLGTYALAASLGRGTFSWPNLLLLAAAAGGLFLFIESQGRTEAPLVSPTMLRDPLLGSNLAAGALVCTVVMATMVVGPFYLASVLGHDIARIGLVLSAGPLTVAATGVPAGRLADRVGPRTVALAGLWAMAAGCSGLALLPAAWGLSGYLAALIVTTAGYSLFQTGNTTMVMASAGAAQRGLVSGLLSLSRNLGLITGASAMATLFGAALGGEAPAAAPPEAVAAAMHLTFAAAALLVLLALAISLASRGSGHQR